MSGAVYPLPQYAFMVWCLVKHRDNFTFTFYFYHAMETHGGVAMYLHAFLTLAFGGGEWTASRPSRFTHQGKSPWYLMDKRLGGPQSRSGRGGEDKNSIIPLPGIEPRSSSLKPSHYTD
jgi:hypothetical protein